MSYNIKHGVGNDGELDLSRAMEVIKSQTPDLVALQEIDHLAQRSDSVDQTAFFANALGMTGYFGQFMPFQGGAYGMATLSEKTIKSTKLLSLPDGIHEPRISIVQEIEMVKGTYILFANVHFDWISGLEGQKSRSAQATALIKYLDQFDLPTIITGDFNCEPESPTMKLFYEAGFQFADKGSDHLSFQGNKKVEIDHVIFRDTESAELKVKFIDLLDEPLVSDHRPLVAKMELTY
ncbi:MAG: endonuclease/exonuclease/phosphatase family protein [Cytophagia bacterium]|nr:endonuclease/exonuclease/phosphatase family protein [Cytophagia bacterium]